MRLPIYQIDAFASQVFSGNPAAVCPLAGWLPDATLQAIAAENNLSETAFFVGSGGRYRIRWFTPAQEVDLCGHATLASGEVVLGTLEPGLAEAFFESASGPLRVGRDGERLVLDFPARPPQRTEVTSELVQALGARPQEAWRSRDLMAVFAAEADVRHLSPDMERVAALDTFALSVTAPGRASDFVSRFFAPGKGIPEDPVTGSAHCTLVPYWADRLGKTKLHALQVSARGGELFCELLGERVLIAGRAVRYLEGTIEVPDPG
jgi:PhzF family phenazine biosynthesis protein